MVVTAGRTPIGFVAATDPLCLVEVVEAVEVDPAGFLTAVVVDGLDGDEDEAAGVEAPNGRRAALVPAAEEVALATLERGAVVAGRAAADGAVLDVAEGTAEVLGLTPDAGRALPVVVPVGLVAT